MLKARFEANDAIFASTLIPAANVIPTVPTADVTWGSELGSELGDSASVVALQEEK